jgi:hypothetical protein
VSLREGRISAKELQPSERKLQSEREFEALPQSDLTWMFWGRNLLVESFMTRKTIDNQGPHDAVSGSLSSHTDAQPRLENVKISFTRPIATGMQ